MRLVPRDRRKWARPFGLTVLAALVGVGVLLDVFDSGVSAWFSHHQFVTAIIAEAILLGAVYLGFNSLVRRAEAERWLSASAEPLRLLASSADLMDGSVQKLISDDRDSVDRSDPGLKNARARHQRFKQRLDSNQPLLTASPYLIEFLPVCIDLERYAAFLLRSQVTTSDRLHIEWYDKAVRAFIAKIAEAVDLREFSQEWLDRTPESAFRRQLRRTSDPDRKRFLRNELRERGDSS